MRIAIITELYPPIVVGGAEVSSKYLAESLAKKHDVIVLTPNYGKPTIVTKKGRLTIHRFHFKNLMRKGQLPNRSMGNPLAARAYFRKMKPILDDFKPDIIHAQNSLSFYPASLYKKAKKIATLRDYSSLCDCGICSLKREFEQHDFVNYLKMKYRWQPSPGRLLMYPLDYTILKMKQSALRNMDGVICVSEYVESVYRDFTRK